VAGLQKNPLWSQVRGTFPGYLEDRRLWSGEVKDVARFTWGPPGKTWTGVREQDFFQLTGPDNQKMRRPAIRVELALLKLRDLEIEGRQPSGATSEATVKNSLELRDTGGKTIFRLEELGETNGKVKVRYAADGQALRKALVAKKAYEHWQQDMVQLTTPRPAQQEEQKQ